MAMVNVVTIAAYRRIYWLRLIGLVQRLAATWRCVLHSSDEPGELSQWQCTATMTAPQTLSWLLLLLLLGCVTVRGQVNCLSHLGQLSLAIPTRVGAMSTSRSCRVSRHTALCTGFMAREGFHNVMRYDQPVGCSDAEAFNLQSSLFSSLQA